MSTVLLGYLLTRALVPNKRTAAVTVAWLLAAGGLWPLLSVHQLVEMVCIPPLMVAFWALAKNRAPSNTDMVLAGINRGL